MREALLTIDFVDRRSFDTIVDEIKKYIEDDSINIIRTNGRNVSVCFYQRFPELETFLHLKYCGSPGYLYTEYNDE